MTAGSWAAAAVHMVAMKILNLNSRYTNQVDVAVPFDSDAQVLAAWDYIMANGWAESFRYDPEIDGEDLDRAWMGEYLSNHRDGASQPVPEADQVRRAIRKIWGAEMNYDVRELIGVEV